MLTKRILLSSVYLMLSAGVSAWKEVDFFWDENCESYIGSQSFEDYVLPAHELETLPGFYGANSLRWNQQDYPDTVCGDRGPAELLLCTDLLCKGKQVSLLGHCTGSSKGAWAAFLCPNIPPPPTSTVTTSIASTTVSATTESSGQPYHSPPPSTTTGTATVTCTEVDGSGPSVIGISGPFGDDGTSAAAAAAQEAAQGAKAGDTTIVQVSITQTKVVEVFDESGNRIDGKYGEGETIGKSGESEESKGKGEDKGEGTSKGKGGGGGGGGGGGCDDEGLDPEACLHIDKR